MNRELARHIDQVFTHLFEQFAAIEADPTLGRCEHKTEPVPMSVYEAMVGDGFTGERPIWRQHQEWLLAETRFLQPLARAELEREE
jgi:hypothetical protein